MFVGHSFYSGRVKLVWTFGVMRLISRMLCGLLFLPICSILLQVFSCGKDGFHNVDHSVVCWEG